MEQLIPLIITDDEDEELDELDLEILLDDDEDDIEQLDEHDQIDLERLDELDDEVDEIHHWLGYCFDEDDEVDEFMIPRDIVEHDELDDE